MYSTIKGFIHVCFLHTETLYPWEIANILFKDCNRTRNSFGFIMTQLMINLWCCVLYPPCHFHSSSDWHFNMLLRGQAVLSCWILFFSFTVAWNDTNLLSVWYLQKWTSLQFICFYFLISPMVLLTPCTAAPTKYVSNFDLVTLNNVPEQSSGKQPCTLTRCTYIRYCTVHELPCMVHWTVDTYTVCIAALIFNCRVWSPSLHKGC